MQRAVGGGCILAVRKFDQTKEEKTGLYKLGPNKQTNKKGPTKKRKIKKKRCIRNGVRFVLFRFVHPNGI